MKALFIVLLSLVILFFLARCGIMIWGSYRKEQYFNGLLFKILNDCVMAAYLVILYCASLAIYLVGIYGIEESNFTLIIAAIALVAYAVEKVLKHAKNRGQMCIVSNIYDLHAIAKSSDGQGVLSVDGKQIYLVDEDAFAKVLAQTEMQDFNAAQRKKWWSIAMSCGVGILSCILVLVLGLVVSV